MNKDSGQTLKLITVDIEFSIVLIGSTSFSLASGKQLTTFCMKAWVIFLDSLSAVHWAFLSSSLSNFKAV